MIHRTRTIVEPFGFYGVRCVEPCIWQRKTVSESRAEARAVGTAHAKAANAEARNIKGEQA
jgi:hypothetical protein